MRLLDLSKISTPQLLEIRSILAGGVFAEAETKNKEFSREKKWRSIVEDYDLEWIGHESYWMGFENEDTLRWVCDRIATARKATANAEKQTLSAIETVRQFFKERKHHG